MSRTIEVQLFALARERAGAERVSVVVDEPATVGALRLALAAQTPKLAELARYLLVAVGAEYAADDRQIPPGVEVAAFPPVSGG